MERDRLRSAIKKRLEQRRERLTRSPITTGANLRARMEELASKSDTVTVETSARDDMEVHRFLHCC